MTSKKSEFAKTMQLEGANITGERHTFGGVFKMDSWVGSTDKRAIVGLTDNNLARMLIFAAGSLEAALNALSYESEQMNKEKRNGGPKAETKKAE